MSLLEASHSLGGNLRMLEKGCNSDTGRLGGTSIRALGRLADRGGTYIR